MKAKRSEKRGLGKGLGALIPVAEPEDEETVREINIEDIRPNSFQPRRAFDEEKLAEMAESVRTHGILQPVVVRSIIGGYELVAGERRWRAAQLAGLVRIPAVIRELSEGEMMEVALIENIQREDLNPLEEAEAFKILLTEFGLTQEELAQRVGKSRSHIANILRLLNLTPEVQSYVSRGTITMGHARALLALSEPPPNWPPAGKWWKRAYRFAKQRNCHAASPPSRPRREEYPQTQSCWSWRPGSGGLYPLRCASGRAERAARSKSSTIRLKSWSDWRLSFRGKARRP